MDFSMEDGLKPTPPFSEAGTALSLTVCSFDVALVHSWWCMCACWQVRLQTWFLDNADTRTHSAHTQV